MKAIIPVAGKGTRMLPHTLNHPKVLLPVAGKPMIDYIVDELQRNGIREIVFIIGYLGEEIQRHINRSYPDISAVFVEQNEMLGLGHAISLAKPHIENNEEVFIVLGDTLFDVDFGAMVKTPHSNLGVKYVEDPSRFGVAVVENGFITRVVEKPASPISNQALVGLYFIKESDVLFESLDELFQKNIRTRGEYQLTDALQLMMDRGIRFIPFNVENWYDCGKPETLLNTTFIMLKKNRDNSEKLPAKIKRNNLIHPPVYIHPDADIQNSIIGPNVSIGEKTNIRNCIISESVVGNNSKIENQILIQSLIGNHTSVTGKAGVFNIGDYSKIE
jgi:glucose-1-phosphate thymidylyltransferase